MRRDPWIDSAGVAAGLAGAAYILAFSALTFANALQAKQDFLGVLLLTQTPADLSHLFHARTPVVLTPQDWTFLSSVGVLYGWICLGALLVGLTVAGFGAPKLITSVVGLFLGFFITTAAVRWFEGGAQNYLPDLQVLIVKFVYVYLLYLVVEVAKERLNLDRPWRPQFGFLFDGLFAIASSLIIASGYTDRFANLLLGPIFLVTSFLAMLVVEATATRTLLSLFSTLHDLELGRFAKRVQGVNRLPPRKQARARLKLLNEAFRANIGRPIGELALAYRRAIASVEADPANDHRPAGVLIIELRTTTWVLALLLIWPWIGLGMLYLALWAIGR
jgi:hypothetical protein